MVTFTAWLLFLTIDFLAHAVLLKSIWAGNLHALKNKEDLFRLIPLGYLSFFILTFLVGWLYVRLFRTNGNAMKGLKFGAIFGGLFALSIFFGWFSFLNLPPVFLFLASFVYFVEIAAVGFTYGYFMHSVTIKKRLWALAGIIIFGFLLGIILQNTTASP